jgi:hypothetical protein
MPLAEIHRKVGRDYRQAEDTLTGSAFGILTLLPPERALIPWFERAVRMDGAPLDLPRGVHRHDARFWPSLGQGGACQPDVLFSFSGSGSEVGIIVEVKFRSDMSGWPTSAEDDPEVRAQLGREWLTLQHLAPRLFPGSPATLDRRILLYVTAGTTFPRSTFDVVAQELASKSGSASEFLTSAYWLSWFSLADVLSALAPGAPPLQTIAIHRLLELMSARRLRGFNSISRPRRPVRVSWAYVNNRKTYAERPRARRAITWNYSSKGKKK